MLDRGMLVSTVDNTNSHEHVSETKNFRKYSQFKLFTERTLKTTQIQKIFLQFRMFYPFFNFSPKQIHSSLNDIYFIFMLLRVLIRNAT